MGGGREVQEEEDICVPNVQHDWFLLVYDRKQYNTVKQLSFS